MNRLRVYISGPITLGDRQHNFDQAAAAHARLMLAGFAVLNPMLTMRLPFGWDSEQFPHDLWLAGCLPWVSVADAVLRLPGESRGADLECAYAGLRGIPVFYDIVELIETVKG